MLDNLTVFGGGGLGRRNITTHIIPSSPSSISTPRIARHYGDCSVSQKQDRGPPDGTLWAWAASRSWWRRGHACSTSQVLMCGLTIGWSPKHESDSRHPSIEEGSGVIVWPKVKLQLTPMNSFKSISINNFQRQTGSGGQSQLGLQTNQ